LSDAGARPPSAASDDGRCEAAQAADSQAADSKAVEKMVLRLLFSHIFINKLLTIANSS
jgi:hypothetical protein